MRGDAAFLVVLGISALTAMPAEPVVGQVTAPAPGDQIRIRTLGESQRTGTYRGTDGRDLLVDGSDGGGSRLSLASVVELQRQSRTRRLWRPGAVLGLGLGTVVAVALGPRSVEGSEARQLAAVVAGGVIGGAIGSRITAPRWQPVPLRLVRPEPLPGTWVRVRRDGETIEGTLGRSNPGEMTIQREGHPLVTLTPEEFAGLEWPMARSRKTLSGAAIGSGIGLVFGALIGVAAYQDCSGEWLCFGPGLYAVVGAIGGGLSGMAVGSVIGYTSYRTVWERRSVPSSLTVAPAIIGRRLGVAMSVRF